MNRERGRENGSFPVAETLKPLGFKAEAREAGRAVQLPSLGTRESMKY